jgi:transcriptional regulator with XRE-family HTH domain
VETLREFRRQKGWSQKDLAEASGIGQDTISGIERGQHEPRPSTLRKLAEALDVEVADFFREPAVPLAEAPRRAGPMILSPKEPASPFEVAYEIALAEKKDQDQASARAHEAQGIPQSLRVDWYDRLEEQYAELYPDPEYRYSRVLNSLLFGANRIVRLEEENTQLKEENAALRDRLQERERAHS